MAMGSNTLMLAEKIGKLRAFVVNALFIQPMQLKPEERFLPTEAQNVQSTCRSGNKGFSFYNPTRIRSKKPFSCWDWDCGKSYGNLRTLGNKNLSLLKKM
ncbi:hypothetical protein AMECASPLE_034748 [Ameca splendens]|uniref:Uncharacterized protein n=1 Tax=Ameca splendens TaxID=208324 RepID=A0ABV0YIN0_9TELE